MKLVINCRLGKCVSMLLGVALVLLSSTAATPNSYLAWNADPNARDGFSISTAMVINSGAGAALLSAVWCSTSPNQIAKSVLGKSYKAMQERASGIKGAYAGGRSFYKVVVRDGKSYVVVIAKMYFKPNSTNWDQMRLSAQAIADYWGLATNVMDNFEPVNGKTRKREVTAPVWEAIEYSGWDGLGGVITGGNSTEAFIFELQHTAVSEGASVSKRAFSGSTRCSFCNNADMWGAIAWDQHVEDTVSHTEDCGTTSF